MSIDTVAHSRKLSDGAAGELNSECASNQQQLIIFLPGTDEQDPKSEIEKRRAEVEVGNEAPCGLCSEYQGR